jgi:hypothetical protein
MASQRADEFRSDHHLIELSRFSKAPMTQHSIVRRSYGQLRKGSRLCGRIVGCYLQAFAFEMGL